MTIELQKITVGDTLGREHVFDSSKAHNDMEETVNTVQVTVVDGVGKRVSKHIFFKQNLVFVRLGGE